MKNKNPKNSRRALRVGEEVRSALMWVILNNEFQDRLISRDVISISEVCMSVDLRVATVYISLPLDVSPDRVISALNCNIKFIRGRIGRSLRNLRYVPELRFRYDTSLQSYWKLNALMCLQKIPVALEK
ncbi:ribosome-binding factor A [Candidatus Liberibacter asiaticus]|uniref:ribosome-binding factor A n=1 Tax=Liberibacter asiaticus TaxID=34021 RepID=UPI000702836F|nr:ribosome-binding factor A [Candidatus Liberibacter asiaticus]AWL13945.1 ribosome-binding factor A [Candidatus Liberibacter asiaticus]KAE9518752.1 Ribosome-binding factor A [Candidatus Liberibacter asiaticus]KRF69034.1 ribosome-binding factor A [Candidatus Liberibacter asiaticus]MBE2996443.1 ribosome-binding factor A [Candidatus Liberibacter asiaticus]MCU7488957.1 ribosome-binding factor A [Candidatus Liberibacter asiaticus]